MKITNLSLTAIMALGMISVVNADVDMKIGGQAVIYYQTADGKGDGDFFDKHSKDAQGNPQSKANAGLQLNLNSDLGNGFGVGLQGSALNTFGLEKNLVDGTMQSGIGGNGDTANATNYFAITKAYLTKRISNTTLKLGRQELPKSLSPFAFTEGFNVFKNTFDAAVAVNSDIPDTTLVGAFVSRSNKHSDLTTFNDMAGGALPSGAYMLTVKNQSIKQLPITLSYYSLPDLTGHDEGSAIWADVQVDAGIPVKFGLQGGQLSPENNMEDTTAMGAKVTGKAGPVSLKLAYSTVDDGSLALKNVGTNAKTPLYTQMIFNQNHIASDADTFLVKGVVPIGLGKLIAQYGATKDNSDAGTDYNELDVIYKFKALGADMLAAYVMSDHDVKGEDPNNIIRFWTRYRF